MPSHKARVFTAGDPVDFRRGHDGLAAPMQSHLRQKPFDGSVHVFRARRADRLKLIYWDGSGLVMAYERRGDNSWIRLKTPECGNVFRLPLAKAPKRSDGLRGGGPPDPPLMMFKIWVLRALYDLSDDQT